jgi:hypothetical protein
MGSVFRAHFFVSQLASVSRWGSLPILDLTIEALDCLAISAVRVVLGFSRLGHSESDQIVPNQRATD